MTAPTPAPTRPDAAPEAPPWGMGEVAVAAVVTLLLSAVLGGLILGVAGVEDTDEASLVVIAVVQTTLWVGMVGSIALVLRRRGASLRDLGLRLRGIDVPVGVAAGVLCQLVLVPLVSAPWTWLTRTLEWSTADIEEPACRLAEKADGSPGGVVLLFLITVVGAPIVEELFFRGFVQRAAVAAFTRNLPADSTDAARTARRVGTAFGLVLTAVLFGLTHFQLQQAPALIAFGLVLGAMAHRSGRLGPSIATHMAFNATTVVSLVILSSTGDDTCRRVLDSALGVAGA